MPLQSLDALHPPATTKNRWTERRIAAVVLGLLAIATVVIAVMASSKRLQDQFDPIGASMPVHGGTTSVLTLQATAGQEPSDSPVT